MAELNKMGELNRFLFSLNCASLMTLFVFEWTPPLSTPGQFLFWPQNYVPFLHLSSHSVVGVRLMMSIFVVILSAFALLFMKALAGRPWNAALLHNSPGILAVLVPLVGWLPLVQHDWVVRILIMIETTAWIVFTLSFLKKPSSLAAWTIPSASTIHFSFWTFLYWRYLDSATLVVPVVACLSYLVWGAHVRPRRPQGNQDQPATVSP
jgi:hypothetical protein